MENNNGNSLISTFNPMNGFSIFSVIYYTYSFTIITLCNTVNMNLCSIVYSVLHGVLIIINMWFIKSTKQFNMLLHKLEKCIRAVCEIHIHACIASQQ